MKAKVHMRNKTPKPGQMFFCLSNTHKKTANPYPFQSKMSKINILLCLTKVLARCCLPARDDYAVGDVPETSRASSRRASAMSAREKAAYYAERDDNGSNGSDDEDDADYGF
jgi:hypothetical protein